MVVRRNSLVMVSESCKSVSSRECIVKSWCHSRIGGSAKVVMIGWRHCLRWGRIEWRRASEKHLLLGEQILFRKKVRFRVVIIGWGRFTWGWTGSAGQTREEKRMNLTHSVFDQDSRTTTSNSFSTIGAVFCFENNLQDLPATNSCCRESQFQRSQSTIKWLLFYFN